MWEKVQTPGGFPRARYDLYLIISSLFIIYSIIENYLISLIFSSENYPSLDSIALRFGCLEDMNS